jgi:hypothetical protein
MGMGPSADTSAGLGTSAMGRTDSLRLLGAATCRLGSAHHELFGIQRSAALGPVLPAMGFLAIRDLGSNSITVGI